MPYIKKDGCRKLLQAGLPATTAGELNYQIFYYMKHYSDQDETVQYCTIRMFVTKFLGDKPNYQRYNDMTGCLIRCYREIMRRLRIVPRVLLDVLDSYDDEIARYEDMKIASNGDVE